MNPLRFVLLLFLLLLLIYTTELPSATASNYYVNSDGYLVYAGDPYFWYGRYAHTRVWVPSYGYGYGYGNTGHWRYTYSHTYNAPTYSTPSVSYTNPNWRSQLLTIAAQRDQAEAAIRKAAYEQQYFKDAVSALGLTNNFRWEAYGAAPPYSYGAGGGYFRPYTYGNLQLSSAGVNGNTAYGYSYNSIASVYGDPNLSQLYQQANRLAENSQKLAGQATSDFSALVGQEGGNRARIAEILARAQAAREFLNALEQPSSKVQTQTFTFKVGSDGTIQRVDNPVTGPNPAVPPMPPIAQPGADKQQPPNPQQAALRNVWSTSAQRNCVDCHFGAKKEGGFDVSLYPRMTPEQRGNVLSRLTTKDNAKVMPRAAAADASKRITGAELQAWIDVN